MSSCRRIANAVAEAAPPAITDAVRAAQYEEHPGVVAWERMIDEVAAELVPQVADMLTEAIRRRLPWSWEAIASRSTPVT